MAFFRWPYTNYEQLNLDWLLRKVKGVDDVLSKAEEALDKANAVTDVADRAAEDSAAARQLATEANTLSHTAEATAAEAREIATQAAAAVIADNSVTWPKLNDAVRERISGAETDAAAAAQAAQAAQAGATSAATAAEAAETAAAGAQTVAQSAAANASSAQTAATEAAQVAAAAQTAAQSASTTAEAARTAAEAAQAAAEAAAGSVSWGSLVNVPWTPDVTFSLSYDYSAEDNGLQPYPRPLGVTACYNKSFIQLYGHFRTLVGASSDSMVLAFTILDNSLLSTLPQGYYYGTMTYEGGNRNGQNYVAELRVTESSAVCFVSRPAGVSVGQWATVLLNVPAIPTV